jgi:hypothetical protein
MEFAVYVTRRSGGDCRASRWRFHLQSCHRSFRGRLSGVSIAFLPPVMSFVVPGEIVGSIDCVFTSNHVTRRSGGDCREYRLSFHLQSCHSSFRGRLPGVSIEFLPPVMSFVVPGRLSGVSMAFSPPVMSFVVPGEIVGSIDCVFTSSHVIRRSGRDCRAYRLRFYLQSSHSSFRERLPGVSIAFLPPIMSFVVPGEIAGSIDCVFTSSHVIRRSGGD